MVVLQHFPQFSLFLGIEYLYSLSSRLDTPIVILVPLGGNSGPRNGDSVIERYIDYISRTRGITAVVPVGNQGDSDTHTSGVLEYSGQSSDIELKIDKNQNNMKFEIWIKKPGKVSLSIISPTGETIDKIIPKSNKEIEFNFLYEGTKIFVRYFLPEEQTGDERIIITARDIKEGIWIFRLTGDLGTNIRYDSYLMQREILAPDTKFLKPDPYITLTVPSTSRYAISVAAYNQNNNSNVRESGKGYTRDDRVKPDIAAGGVNALTTAPGGRTQTVSGTSVAAAVVAGCCALIFQWARVEGNDPAIYAVKVKTYLIRGTSKRAGDTYPNPEWGYGTINMTGVFDNIRSLIYESESANFNRLNREIEYFAANLFVRLPNI